VCGDAYLAELRAQAQRIPLSPMLITNRPISPNLQLLLQQHGIQHLQMAD